MTLNSLLFAIAPNTPIKVYKGDEILFNGTWSQYGYNIFNTKYKVMGIDPCITKSKLLYLSIEVE